MEFAIPNKNNFCGGSFQDWLEVNLIDKCNGKCSWCVERDGYHPKRHATWQEMALTIRRHGAKNVMLLGGEPTLYPMLRVLIINLAECGGHKVWLTTNGSMLTKSFVRKNLEGLAGINISIHHTDLALNRDITGISLNYDTLLNSIYELHKLGIPTRLNCNCIKGYIDDEEDMLNYIRFARNIGARNVRFAELKIDENNFVDLTKIYGDRFGLNNDPFTYGCVINTVIDEMPVNFRQMCGLQTSKRIKPVNPKQYSKAVLYYDGIIYNGWQTTRNRGVMKSKELRKLLKDVKDGKKSIDEVEILIQKAIDKNEVVTYVESGGGCQY